MMTDAGGLALQEWRLELKNAKPKKKTTTKNQRQPKRLGDASVLEPLRHGQDELLNTSGDLSELERRSQRDVQLSKSLDTGTGTLSVSSRGDGRSITPGTPGMISKLTAEIEMNSSADVLAWTHDIDPTDLIRGLNSNGGTLEPLHGDGRFGSDAKVYFCLFDSCCEFRK